MSVEPTEMITRLRQLLKQERSNGIELEIPDDGFVKEGEWVLLVVNPTKPGIRAYDYVDRLSKLEKELRKQVGEQVMLVPAVPD